MALLGVSLILASFVLFCMRRQDWFPSIFRSLPPRLPIEPPPQNRETPEDDAHLDRRSDSDVASVARDEPKHESAAASGRALGEIPLSPLPRVVQREAEPDTGLNSPSAHSTSDGQTTPKASATVLESSVPAFALSAPEDASSAAPKAKNSSAPTLSPSSSSSSSSSLMPPPPRPPTLRPLPSASQASSTSSSLAPAPRARNNLPLPSRAPGCSTLAPPPTHSSKPSARARPSRAVALSPGHSPLDWARLTGDPRGAERLRGLPPGTPYLRVTPRMLRRQTGRRGRDAWTVLGGRVYNISPYLPFHPGGEAELLRGAGRDGTRLFGEVHPWVNYEGMLAACLVGIYVAEEEGGEDMEAMN